MAAAAAVDAPSESVKFLPALTEAAKKVAAQGGSIDTLDFTNLCDTMIMVFDYLGTVFYFAKTEMQGKTDSLKEAAKQHAKLNDIVVADRAAGKVTTKNSCARNLHRLMSALDFVTILLEKLVDNPTVTVGAATSAAYDATLAEIHTMIVRTAIRAGLWALPSRDAFISSIGETEETAKPHATVFIENSRQIAKNIAAFYQETMPASTFSMWPL